MIFRKFSAFSDFTLHGNPNSELRFGFLVEFYVDYFFEFFFHFCIIEETQDAKMLKNPCFAQLFEIKTKFCHVISVSSIIFMFQLKSDKDLNFSENF